MKKIGLAKESRDIEHTKVYIRVGGKDLSDGAVGRTSSPKAYHFCRAHLRRLADGEIARVRAHWRGDPAFGIRLPRYEVRPAVH